MDSDIKTEAAVIGTFLWLIRLLYQEGYRTVFFFFFLSDYSREYGWKDAVY